MARKPKVEVTFTQDDLGDFEPATFAVIQHRESGTKRIGNYTTLFHAEQGIIKLEKLRRETYGGLLQNDSTPTHYSIWECDSYKRIK